MADHRQIRPFKLSIPSFSEIFFDHICILAVTFVISSSFFMAYTTKLIHLTSFVIESKYRLSYLCRIAIKQNHSLLN